MDASVSDDNWGACDTIVFLVVATLITDLLFEQLLIRTQAQLEDSTTGPILKARESGIHPGIEFLTGQTQQFCRLVQQWDQLEVKNGLLYRRFELSDGHNSHLQLVVPKQLQPQILNEVHGGGRLGGHLGEHKTRDKLRECFYWPGLSRSVQEWCQTCASTQGTYSKHRRGPLQNVKAGYPLDIIAMDIVGPLPTSTAGNRYILVISNYFTR